MRRDFSPEIYVISYRELKKGFFSKLRFGNSIVNKEIAFHLNLNGNFAATQTCLSR